MSSVIHFTKEFDTLKSILSESSFRLKYCREVFYLGENIASSAVHPMVSFSECLVKTIDKKNITYGKFGIGLKREWVTRKRLHPVLYMDNNSHIAEALANLLNARRKRAKIELAPRVRHSIMVIKCFTKNAHGYNSNSKINDFNFKAEKEWRYVPTKSQINDNLISQNKRLYDNRPSFYNNKLKDFPLKFKMTDIEYIFVETNRQRDEIWETFGIEKTAIKISKWTSRMKL